MLTIDLREDDLWLIHEYVRQTRNAPEYGMEHDRDFMERIHAALLAFTPADGQEQLESIDVSFTEAELWQITRQVSPQITQGSRKIGREVLLKVIAALARTEVPDDVPALYRNAYTNEDDGADDNARETVSAG